MKTIRTLVVDDEPVSRLGLVRMLSQYACIETVGEAHNSSVFVQAVKELKPDLVFLDIMLRDVNSLDVLPSIESGPLYIITTAYGQHALRGYDLRAIDYLMKPIAPERLMGAIERAQSVISGSGFSNNHLFLRSEGRYLRFKTDDILFIQGMENYVVVQTLNARHVCKMTMTYIKHLLPDKDFMQVHKSYIINIGKVDALEKQNLHIQSHVLPISRDKKQDVYRILLGTDQSGDLYL